MKFERFVDLEADLFESDVFDADEAHEIVSSCGKAIMGDAIATC